MQKLIEIIESFIPGPLLENPGDHTRGRFMVSYLFILGVLGIPYNLIYFKVGNPWGASAIIAMVMIIFWLPFHLKKTGNLPKVMHLCGACLTMMNGTIMFTSGGAVFSGNPWWALTPVFATLVIGGKAGRNWLIFVATILGATYAVEATGFRFPDYIIRTEETMNWVRFLDWFHYLGVIFVLTAGALVFDYINSKALQLADKSRLEIESSSKNLESYNRYLDENGQRILGEMEKLAKGDLTSNLEIQKRDAIGQLCEGFNDAVYRVEEAITGIRDRVESTTRASGQIEESANHLKNDANKQSEKASQIASATYEIVALISVKASNARDTAEVANENGTLASEGGVVFNQTMAKMEDIALVVDQTSHSIEALGKSTREIGNIVSLIKGIAGRTNLLALNAAIEAAHAGQMGQGFAVIAEEVKDLAGRTTVETERIATMIQTVQDEAVNAVEQMRDGIDQVNEGKSLALRAGEALNRIVDSSSNVSGLISQIANACEEQSSQNEFLFKQIEELKDVSDSSAKEIAEIAGSTQKLDGMTQDVKRQLGLFRLVEDEHQMEMA